MNFATADWFPQGREAGARYKRFQRGSVMSVQKLLLACVINDPATYTSEVLLDELHVLVKQERAARARLAEHRQPITRMQRLTLGHHSAELINYEVDTELDSMPCSVCQAFCFLSFVRCDKCAAENGGGPARRRGSEDSEEDEDAPPRRGGALCLDHLDHLCDCDVSENVIFYYRFTIDELVEVTQRYERHLRNA